jgi:hypothetical protein
MIEYNRGKAVALVEYKNEHAEPQVKTHPSYRALIDLADRADLPVFACRYTDDMTSWLVVPLNDCATSVLPERKRMTESEYVTFLYGLRRLEIPSEILERLNA